MTSEMTMMATWLAVTLRTDRAFFDESPFAMKLNSPFSTYSNYQ